MNFMKTAILFVSAVGLLSFAMPREANSGQARGGYVIGRSFQSRPFHAYSSCVYRGSQARCGHSYAYHPSFHNSHSFHYSGYHPSCNSHGCHSYAYHPVHSGCYHNSCHPNYSVGCRSRYCATYRPSYGYSYRKH